MLNLRTKRKWTVRFTSWPIRGKTVPVSTGRLGYWNSLKAVVKNPYPFRKRNPRSTAYSEMTSLYIITNTTLCKRRGLFPSLETHDEARVVSNPLIRVGHIILIWLRKVFSAVVFLYDVTVTWTEAVQNKARLIQLVRGQGKVYTATVRSPVEEFNYHSFEHSSHTWLNTEVSEVVGRKCTPFGKYCHIKIKRGFIHFSYKASSKGKGKVVSVLN
jgi:hypothetical protein